MRKKIYKYKEFKILLEKGDDDNNNDEFNFDDLESDTSEEEFDFSERGNDEENPDDNSDDEFGGEEPEEEPKEKVFNEDPGYYVEQALKQIEGKIVALFDEPEEDKKGRIEKDPASYNSQGVELIDVKTTDMPMKKTLIIKYHDEQFTYHLMVTIDMDEGIPEKSDIEMEHTMIEECGVKFKKYDISNNLLGELDRKKVQIKTIDQDFIDTLNSDLDNKYSIDNNFEIEYGKDEE